MQAVFGVLFHFLGGFASGSFYIPYKKVRGWSWETYWLVGGIFSWLIVPPLAAFLTIPGFAEIIAGADNDTLLYTFIFGFLWGIGGLTYGLGVRYLGVSLGSSIILGLTMVLGSLIPSIYYQFSPAEGKDSIGMIVGSSWGQIVLAGLLLCIVGIYLCGKAGMLKEKELQTGKTENKEMDELQPLNHKGKFLVSDPFASENGSYSAIFEEVAVTPAAPPEIQGTHKGIGEYKFGLGIIVAIISGILSACFNFGLEAGKPMAEVANSLWKSVNPGKGEFLFQNNVTYVVVLWGGLTTNLIYCMFLNFRNKSYGNYINTKTPLLKNYIFSALAGTTWFLQFFFYGMGESKMGNGPSSWILHMAFIILVANGWGLVLKEWSGVSKKTKSVIIAGIITIIASVLLVGYGNAIR